MYDIIHEKASGFLYYKKKCPESLPSILLSCDLLIQSKCEVSHALLSFVATNCNHNL